MSDIVAVIDDNHGDSIGQVVAALKACGVDVSRVDETEGIVEGTVETEKIKTLDAIKGVDYVRTVFTYAANYPAGDPRDRDGE